MGGARSRVRLVPTGEVEAPGATRWEQGRPWWGTVRFMKSGADSTLAAIMKEQMYSPKFDARKFDGLVLYAAQRADEDSDRWFGATKLNKILFYCDWVAYRRRGRPITGANYRKLPAGPVPRELLKARDALIDSGRVRLVARPVMTYVQHRLIPTSSVDPLEYFEQDELAIIDEVIDTLAPMTAAQVSELSHREIGWKAAPLGDDIPYETALLSPDAPDDEDDWLAMAAALSSGD